eukprot:12480247-Alexandrium_andersonii.AAC.1
MARPCDAIVISVPLSSPMSDLVGPLALAVTRCCAWQGRWLPAATPSRPRGGSGRAAFSAGTRSSCLA